MLRLHRPAGGGGRRATTPKVNGRARTLVSHPHAAAISQHVASGLSRADALAAYLPGFALPQRLLPPRLEARVRRAIPVSANRIVPDVPPHRLFPLIAPELLARIGRRVTRERFSRRCSWYDVMFVAHDLTVATLPWPRDLEAVYAYEDGALWTFERAGREGVRRFYDLPIVYHRALAETLVEEKANFPDAEPARPEEPAWKRERKDRELALADVAVVASSFTRASLDRAPSLPAEVHVVPYGFPVEAFPARARPPAGPFRVLAVGTHDLRKGTPYLLEAFRRAALPGAKLRLVGPMSLSPAFVARYRDLFEHVPSLPRARLAAEYRAADVLAFPTLGDGFGLVILEAMASGLPVITTRAGGGPECIDDREDGFLVPERDVEALAEALVFAFEHRDVLFAMGQRARAKAERYTERDAGDAFARLVLGTIGKGGRA